jgi:hypothetical protein
MLLPVVEPAWLLNGVFAGRFKAAQAALFILVAERRSILRVHLRLTNRRVGRPCLGTIRRRDRRWAVPFLVCHSKVSD